MQFTRPIVQVPNDVNDIMLRHGWLMGVGLHRCLWRFGFDPGSEDAKAFGVSLPDKKLYVLASVHGRIIKSVLADSPQDLPAGMRLPLSQILFAGDSNKALKTDPK